MLVEDIRGAHFAVRDNLWVRLLDIPKRSRRARTSADADVTISVTDGQIPANDGLWRLRIAGGTAHATKERSADRACRRDAVDPGAVRRLPGRRDDRLARERGPRDRRARRRGGSVRAFAGDVKPVSALNF